MRQLKSGSRAVLHVSILVLAVALGASAADQQKTNKFEGPKANTGMATHSIENGQSVLRVTSDFKVPDTPAPTWRVVDSNGNIYTLAAFKTKAGEKREVVVPKYVPNIAKVQVYCAWVVNIRSVRSNSQMICPL